MTFDEILIKRQQKYLVSNKSLQGEINRLNSYIKMEELDVETLSKIVKMIVMLKTTEDKI